MPAPPESEGLPRFFAAAIDLSPLELGSATLDYGLKANQVGHRDKRTSVKDKAQICTHCEGIIRIISEEISGKITIEVVSLHAISGTLICTR
jgi:hypothetical protein